MNIIHMIDDYRLLCKEAGVVGNFEAYKAYTGKYPYFFQGVFRYLYCQPMENLKPMIEKADFPKLLQTAEKNYASGMVDYTVSSAEKCVESMNADFHFTLLLGLELSNIGGCATPGDREDPYLYIGFDRPLSKEWIDLFIPHEMYHMVRHQMTRHHAPETVFSRTIEEGLASYAPLWVNKLEWNLSNVAKTLGVSQPQAEHLMQNTAQLLDQLVSDGNKPISADTMKEYFTAQTPDAEFPVIGYYIGLYLTHKAVEQGMAFPSFLSMSRDAIIKMWFP